MGDGEDLFPGPDRIVDLEPRPNWGHRCLYLLVDPDDNVTRIEALFPPSRRDLGLVVGSEVEDSMLLTERAI